MSAASKPGVVACTCTPTGLGHDPSCAGSEAVLQALGRIGAVGVAGGALTTAERNLIQGVQDLIRHRLGLGHRDGVEPEIDMAALALWEIRNAAAAIHDEIRAQSEDANS